MAINDESGIYSLDEVPGKPHPHCYCFLTAAGLPTLEELEQALADGDFDTDDNKFSEDPNFNTRLRAPDEVFQPTMKSFRDWEGEADRLFKSSDYLTDDERRYIEEYKGNTYSMVNQAARSGRLDEDSEMSRIADGIDSAISKYTTSRDMMVYRGQDARDFFSYFGIGADGSGSDSLIGKSWTDKSYLSTRLPEEGAFSGRDLQFRINLPKDSNAYFYGEFDSEKEVLLPRDSSFTVVGIEDRDGQWWVDLLMGG